MKMQVADAVQKTTERIGTVYEIASKTYGRNFAFPQITFNVRGRAAGRAYYYQNRIALNMKMLLDNGQDFVDDTPGHEAAHLIAFRLYGRQIRPHGREWASVMRTIGQKPERTHDFEISGFSYFCSCRTHILSTRMHNSIQRDLKSRICVHCRDIIKWEKLHEKNFVTV